LPEAGKALAENIEDVFYSFESLRNVFPVESGKSLGLTVVGESRPESVVLGSFVLIGENLVGLVYFLEPAFVSAFLVGMMSVGQLVIGLF